MKRRCVASGEEFEVIEEDLKFYEKISPVFQGRKYLIPPPTLSPNERQRRRLALRNERELYHRKSDKSGEDMISMYSPEKKYQVYSQEEWWSDGWDAADYGQDFQPGIPFFRQFQELSTRVPRVALINNKAENSPYCNFADGNKNCYLVLNGNWNEGCYYSALIIKCRDSADCFWVLDSELCYECVDSEKCYNVRFSREVYECSDSLFLSDCRGCHNCIGCSNLRNKSYYIWNRPTSKEEYNRQVRLLSKYSELTSFQKRYEQFLLQPPHPPYRCLQSENVCGDHITRSYNVTFSFDVFDSEDCKYVCDMVNCKNCMDGNAIDSGTFCYENTSLIGYENLFTAYCRDSNGLIYCWDCHSCQECFGCIGLRRKKYCILNKQYSKPEYEALAPEIIEHMQNTKEWGEFFPIAISPFAYNETVAQDYFPLTKEEIFGRGWKWKDEEKPDFSGVTKRIPAKKLPDDISAIPDDILNWAIECSESSRPFRIQKAELDFYRRMNLPIPHLHPDLRHQRRMALRNPRKLWARDCMNCGKAIETSYAPERPEIVYCEECYLQTVY